jgi:hypothetical protein
LNFRIKIIILKLNPADSSSAGFKKWFILAAVYKGGTLLFQAKMVAFSG